MDRRYIHFTQYVEIAQDERRPCRDGRRDAVFRQHPQTVAGQFRLPFDGLVRIGGRPDSDEADMPGDCTYVALVLHSQLGKLCLQSLCGI